MNAKNPAPRFDTDTGLQQVAGRSDILFSGIC
jgi:hypothetical protein